MQSYEDVLPYAARLDILEMAANAAELEAASTEDAYRMITTRASIVNYTVDPPVPTFTWKYTDHSKNA